MSLNVTVVIPVKNGAGNLPTCLGRLSAFAKVLVVVSESDDDTCQIIGGGGSG